ncbi:MAG TPA: HEAT repeat domain-containing protein, partial [Gemmatimonadales bacterium]|nr:HEAT repeat domain-containing protein [Gemmatimonadales bacterium]
IGGWLDDDPADSLYKAARAALNASNYRNAAELFRRIRDEQPKSRYVADSYYWEAFARYRSGGSDDLREARRLLAEQQSRYPKAATSGDAAALRTRVEGQLAQLGDADAARRVSVAAESAAPSRNTDGCTEDEDDTRIAALNALLQIDADRAIPILKKVLARREKCSEVLRRKAVFLVSQKRTDETESILLDAARQDPDGEVREQAVFWLSQVGTERSVNALDSILQFSKDPELQKKAVFALSQTKIARAQQVIRDLAAKEGADEEVREQAVFWLGQSRDAGNADFLRTLYGKSGNTDLKEKILFSLSQIHSPASDQWLLDIAQNSKEDIELRKKALFWAGQSRTSSADLVALYDKMKESEMREQLIFVYSQRREPAAVDKLMQIAKTDPDKELKKKAIFWLSQSRDPRAAEFLLQVIEQP